MMRVLTLTTPDIENGAGYRVTLWVAGCSHRCPGCHNKHTWAYDQGTPIADSKIMERVVAEVSKPYIKGLTISGGDPLAQPRESLVELVSFIRRFRELCPGKDVWIYSGFTYEELMSSDIDREVLALCDVLVDGPYVQKLRDTELAFRGSSNQRVIDLKKSSQTGEVCIVSA